MAELTEKNWKEIISRIVLNFYNAMNHRSLGSSSFPLSKLCSLSQSRAQQGSVSNWMPRKIAKMPKFITYSTATYNYAKDCSKELFTAIHYAFFNRIPMESSKIRCPTAVHLGKKFLAAAFSVIVYNFHR